MYTRFNRLARVRRVTRKVPLLRKKHWPSRPTAASRLARQPSQRSRRLKHDLEWMNVPGLVPLQSELTTKVRPDFERGDRTLRLVDLFCGCGGLTLGVALSALRHSVALDVALALDNDENAISVYRSNFPSANAVCGNIDALLSKRIGCSILQKEQNLVNDVGSVDAIVGGPPCQGHSDLNNHTRRDDPKNALYLRMIRAVEVFRPKILLIENVPSVRHSSPDVVGTSASHLSKLGYSVSDRVITLSHLGVPQTRRRHVLLATLIPGFEAMIPLQSIEDSEPKRSTLRCAIGDLAGITNREGIDIPPRSSPTNVFRMQKMLQYDWYDLPNKYRPPCHQNETHSYKSMYGRLNWDKPAQTITSGYTSIGQGRYMHPDETRALTHHEAARLQCFPDYFDFSSALRRRSLTTMIGNAVPPPLSATIFDTLIPLLNIPAESGHATMPSDDGGLYSGRE